MNKRRTLLDGYSRMLYIGFTDNMRYDTLEACHRMHTVSLAVCRMTCCIKI